MIKDILRPNGDVYMTVYTDGDVVEFRDFAKKKLTIRFDAKALDQLIPFLLEANSQKNSQND